MKPIWKKLGLLYSLPSGGLHSKLVSHAANPLPLPLYDDVFRIFFSARDPHNRSSVGAVDIDIVQRIIVKVHDHPFFEHGPKGSFFADGVSIGNCYSTQGFRYMLFMGWQNPPGGHWRGDIGRLIVDPALTLRLDSHAPFIGADSFDPISLSYPWVHGDDTRGFVMWYGSTESWNAGNNEMLHVIKQATSPDGHQWFREGNSLPHVRNVAQAFSRPTVVVRPDGFHQMWFSYRGGAGDRYRIGYAESTDGIKWTLALERSGIGVSKEGWDSEMIEYPFVFDHKGCRYMLYNGNSYGKTGFGLAILESE